MNAFDTFQFQNYENKTKESRPCRIIEMQDRMLTSVYLAKKQIPEWIESNIVLILITNHATLVIFEVGFW